MRNCQIVPGLAAIVSSRWTDAVFVAPSMLSPLLSFGLSLERVQPVAPEVVEKRSQLLEPFRTRSVEASGAVASFAHEPGLLQDGQMLGDRGPSHVEVRGDLSGGELAVADEAQDAAPARLGDCLQGGLHERYLSKGLRKSQLKSGLL